MKKGVIAMLIAFSFAVVSCGGKKGEATEEVAADSVEVVEATEGSLEGEADTTAVVEAEVEG